MWRLVESFGWAALEHVHTRHGATLEAQLSLVAQIARPKTMQAAAGYAGIWSPHQDLVTSETVAAAHGMGLQVAPWSVNDEADMRRMTDAGVDAVITDLPDQLLRVLGR